MRAHDGQRKTRRQACRIESLEGRLLLSALDTDDVTGSADLVSVHGQALAEVQAANAAPTIATAAAASPSPATGTSTNLSVLGADDGGEANLTYTWSVSGTVPGPVSFSVNGTNAARNTTATFSRAGTYSFTVTITDPLGLSTSSSVSVTVNLGLFSDSVDIGSPALAGSLSYNASSGAYTVRGAGTDIWDSSDQFRCSYAPFSGNGQITARVSSVGNTNAWAKAGVMFREGTAANAAFAMVVATPGSGVSFQWRGTAGSTPGQAQVTGITAPVWVRLVRSGSQFSGYYSLNNVTWTQIGSAQTVSMATSALAGLAVTSHNAGALTTTVIDNVSVEGPVAARGRPTLNASRTTFVGDNGQLLRGPFTSTEWTGAIPQSEMQKIKSLGFNAVHLYAESFDPNYPNTGSTAPGYAASRVDQIVQSARDLGLYVIMTIGNGANNGNHNRQYVEDFWRFYAPRYANETHVLFEVQNEPVAWGPPYSSSSATPPGAVDMEVSAYNIIRTYAPSTPVMLFSYAVLGDAGGASAALQDIRAFNQAVFGNSNAIWTNEAAGFHGYAGAKATATAAQAILSAGYPMLMTEFAGGTWGTGEGGLDVDMVAALEQMQVSWLTFQHIPPWGVSDDITSPAAYTDVVERSGLSWTPDYGTWPASRSPYGNGGLPRSTTSTYTNNQLTGTLRIQAEDFDNGAQGVAYNDADSANQGGQYRAAAGVDIAGTADAGGGYAVSWTAGGEWLEYTIKVEQPGYYDLSLRYASAAAAGAVRILAQGVDVTGQLTLAGTGGPGNWATLTRQVFFGYGRQKLRIEVLTGGFDLNWIELTPQPLGPVSSGVYVLVNRHSGQAMHFDTAANLVVQQPVSPGSNLQRWNLQSLGAGQFKITSAQNGNSWNAGGGMNSDLGMVWWWGTSGGQMFLVRPAGDGYYRIAPVGSGHDYDVENSSVSAGASIIQSRYAGRPSQQWALLTPEDQVFPTGLLAFWNDSGKAQLTWTAAPGATAYNVKRATTPGGPYTTIAAGLTGAGYVDASASASATYYYVISAVGAGGNESFNSAEVSLSMPRALLRFDEGAGTTAADATGHGWTGTLQNGAAWSTGISGNAVSLDGVNDYVSLPNGVVNGLTDFTISLWVNLAANPAWSRIFDFGTGTSVNMFLSANPGNANSLRFAITASGSGNEQRISGTGLALGTWNHVAVTLSGGVGTLYVNGQVVGTNNSMTLNPSSLGVTNRNYLGKSQYSDPSFSGSIDDFRIYSSGLSSGEIASLHSARFVPAVATAASASPSAVNGTTTQLAVLGADDNGEAGLIYTWSLMGTPPAPVAFSVNGSNAAKSTVATFTRAGIYSFLVSITDAAGFTVTSPVAVTVNQVLTGVSVAPSSAPVTINTSRQFSATARDQFGEPLAAQPAFTWSIASGGGSVSSSGLYMAPGTAGAATVKAQAGSYFATASVNVTAQAAPSIVNPAAASPSPAGTSTALSVRGGSSAGESVLTYTWSVSGTAPGPVSFSVNGSNAARNTTATFSRAGTYSFTVTITDPLGLSASSAVSVTVNLGLFSDSVDIGSPALAGSLSYNAGSGAYTVRAAGTDIWDSSDQFRCSYAPFSGNGQITVRVSSVGNTNAWAKAGVMFREGTAANAAFAMVVATPGSGVSFQWRGTAGGTPGQAQVTGIAAPVWVRLVRSGSQFSGYYSLNNVTWTQIGSAQTVSMATSALAGLAVTSHNAGALTTSVIDNVWMDAPITGTDAADTFIVRRDGTGQNVEVYRQSAEPANRIMTRAAAGLPALTIRGAGGDDVVVIDFANGDPVPAGGCNFEAGGGRDRLVVAGTRPTDSLAIHPGQVIVGSSVIASDAEVVQLGQGNADIVLGSLTFAGSSAAALPPGGNRVIKTSGLSLPAGATLDLADGGMIVSCADAAAAEAMRALIEGWIASSRNAAGGRWTGSGVTSSAARARSDGITGLAVIVNNDGRGNVIRAGLGSQVAGLNSVLVMHTYNGDGNLDGRIDAADYLLIDRGMLAGGAGYRNGDFNYNGRIDGDDYFLIDSAFLAQPALLSGSAAGPVMLAAPPAPPASHIAPPATHVVTRIAAEEACGTGTLPASPAPAGNSLFEDWAIATDDDEVW